MSPRAPASAAARLGVDTGGTYTDAVLLDAAGRVIRTAKALTTRHDLALGVDAAVAEVLGADPPPIELVGLSTTLATNAVVEGHGSPVCLILVGQSPAVLGRSGLREALADGMAVFVEGGHGATGDELRPLDVDAARSAILEHAHQVAAFAVASQFAVRNPGHETAIRDLVLALTDRPVTCTHELSARLDAPRRAVTAVLNARLIPYIRDLVVAVRRMLEARSIDVPLMVVKGDGALISADAALARPIETILSGPAASVVGASHLCGAGGAISDAVIADMGGTTTDVAVLRSGWPALAPDGAVVGGWRTMVSAVAAHTFGLGGDSEIRILPGGRIAVGPRRSVPLALLADCHPRVLDTLRERAADPLAGRLDGAFALRLRERRAEESALSRGERRIYEALAQGPVEISRLLADHPFERSLERLKARGLVIGAGLTPSDAAHVLGLQSTWCAEASRLGAMLLARVAGDGDPRALSRRVHEAVVVDAAKALLRASLAEDQGALSGRTFDALEPLLDRTLGGSGSPAAGALLDLDVVMRRPIVAVGAPVASYYPDVHLGAQPVHGVARRLGTTVRSVPHAAVANAVGAVASRVMETVAVTVTSPAQGSYRVHTGDGIADHPSLESAIEAAESHARERALARALAVGAVTAEVSTQREDRFADLPGGERLFLESRVRASAVGPPARPPPAPVAER